MAESMTQDISERKQPMDAAESYHQALSRARAERGEPERGLPRALWETREWARYHPMRLAGFGLSALAGIAALIYAGARLARTQAEKESSQQKAA